MRLPRLCCVAVCIVAAAGAGAASVEVGVPDSGRPVLAEWMALSPDGQRIAYTTRAGRELAIVIFNLEPVGGRRVVRVEPEREAGVAEDRPPPRLRFLRWATNERLVFAPVERVVPLPPVVDAAGGSAPNPDGPTRVSPILAVDADGRQQATLVDARTFIETAADARKTLADLLRSPQQLAAANNEPARWRMPHVDILGFFPRDRNQLIVRTHGAYAPPALHLVDIRTGSVREFGVEWPAPPGEPHVYDWFRLKVVGERAPGAAGAVVWRDPELERMQRELEAKFPRRTVELVDWSDHRARVLARVRSGAEAGRLFVYHRPEDLVVEILRLTAKEGK